MTSTQKRVFMTFHSIRSRGGKATHSASISSSRAHTPKKINKVIFRHSQPQGILLSKKLSSIFPPILPKQDKHLSVLLDSGLKSNGVGANDLADLLAVLEEQESGHGADGLLLGDLGDLVDVDLVEAGVGVVVREPVGRRVSGSVSLARPSSSLSLCSEWVLADL
jgi:hypothetical protein